MKLLATILNILAFLLGSPLYAPLPEEAPPQTNPNSPQDNPPRGESGMHSGPAVSHVCGTEEDLYELAARRSNARPGR
jgi:hypothetical protein